VRSAWYKQQQTVVEKEYDEPSHISACSDGALKGYGSSSLSLWERTTHGSVTRCRNHGFAGNTVTAYERSIAYILQHACQLTGSVFQFLLTGSIFATAASVMFCGNDVILKLGVR
jgi:hypothetical protein